MINFEHSEGTTPIDPEEAEGLLLPLSNRSRGISLYIMDSHSRKTT